LAEFDAQLAVLQS